MPPRARSAFAAALALALVSGSSIASATAAPTITEFEPLTQDLAPSGITAGPDGNLWFASTAKPVIGRSTPTGAISEYTTNLSDSSQGIVAGADGNVWFTEPKADKIGRITTLGAVTEYAAEGEPTGITAGPDGNLWFTEPAQAGAIGRINPTTGKVNEFSVNLTPKSSPLGITAGPDGALWFTERSNAAIGRITTTGTITEYGGKLMANSQPTGITAGPDGALWFTERSNAAIGRITTAGTITEYGGKLMANSLPTGITAADDGNLHFTEAGPPGQIGTITPAGLITELATPTTNSQPAGITPGPDGNLWFTEVGNHGRIARMTVAPGVASGSATGVTEQNATLNAEVTPNSQATTYRFQYGPTAATYGSQTSPTSAGSGAGAAPVSAPVTGLAAGSTYHFRAVASNATGTTYGEDSTFTTPLPPSALTQAATTVTATTAMLNGTVNPDSQPTTYHFDWGTTTAYGGQLPLVDAGVGSDGSEHVLAQSLEGLTPDTLYHFRLVATNCGGCAEGTAYGSDHVFATAVPPIAITGGVQGIGFGAARVTGSVNPNGAMTTYHVDWGRTSAYGSQTPTVDSAVGSDSALHPLTQDLTGLASGVVYHYRIVATNCEGCPAGTSYGGDATLTTESARAIFAPLVPMPLPPSPPSIGRTALASVLSGHVTVRTPGGATSQPIAGATDIPMGALIDAGRGTLLLTTAIDSSAHVQSATLWGGTFVIGQTVARHGMTTFTLAGPLNCAGHARRASARAASTHTLRRKASRGLWAKDKHGHFSTRGQNSVATVRGTYWETVDRCNGTLTVVKRGAVSVRDLRRRRAVLVRAGHSYLARP